MSDTLLQTMVSGLSMGLFLGTVGGLIYQIIAGFVRWTIGRKE